eukprot:Em0008g793a
MTWKKLCLAASVVAVVLFACGSFIALPSALFFSSTAKENCKVALMPFLCLYFFPICDDAGATLHPDAGYCEEISSSVCKEEWNVAIAMGIESLLPQCGLLSSEQSFLNRKCIDELINISAVTLVLNKSLTHLQCEADFVLYNGTCRPRCDSWESSSGVRLKIISILAAAIGIVSEIAFLSAAIVNRKVMLSFPKVLVVYMVIDLLVLTALPFINYSDRGALFCSSSDLITNIDHPSVFCNLSAPIAATFATNGFSMAQFPPFFCYPKNGTVMYYSLVLPFAILLVIGIAMLAAVIWKIHKHHGLLRERYIGTNQPALPPVSDAERKLLLTSLYYLIIGTSVTTSMSINSQHGDAIRLKLGEYFLCSSAGTITADILVTNWDSGISVAFDITVTSPLNSSAIMEVGMYSGVAARAAEFRKHSENDTKCAQLSYSAWGPEALMAFSQVATHLAICGNTYKSKVLADLYGCLSHTLIRANACAILTRSYSHLVQQLDELCV